MFVVDAIEAVGPWFVGAIVLYLIVNAMTVVYMNTSVNALAKTRKACDDACKAPNACVYDFSLRRFTCVTDPTPP